ncbi:ferritin-like domain-containing protein [Basilea psittacipulmonis]|uniref:Uncharacterized protein n=1 Tax=Basilea psittacipulmonis DSM 24701 TaxID=1072685 RepID=A0A077DHJ7_9BURK|nr:ferritin-like domain-containing protein [Basilea psittacipulmonis]AIL32613.1 hypothetical protein IX83_04185 [Basilea psittacipulmonis DSM 24701]
MDMRRQALNALCETDIEKKCQLVQAISQDSPIDTHVTLTPHLPIPGIPAKPELVDPRTVPVRSVTSKIGHAAMLHAITHIEFNAINLALDAIWRFDSMPTAYYQNWLQVAKEEVYHFSLVNAYLNELGYQYGDFPAHRGLWDMAEKTQDDLLARIALVPRYLEARGLDVNPIIQEKLQSIADQKGIDILTIILRDEIGHVRFGSIWFHYLCQERNLDPAKTYRDLLNAYQLAKPQGKINLSAREQAGFSDTEITWFSTESNKEEML